MKLVIIGNGFDLHHGLRTTFKDFRAYLTKGENHELVNNIDSIIQTHVKGIDVDNIELAWNDIEGLLQKVFSKVHGNEDKLDEFEDIVEDFISEFYSYLEEQENISNIKMNDVIDEKIRDSDVALVFNYTKTYAAYVDTNRCDVYHIHGCLDLKNLPLIGYYNVTLKARQDSDYHSRYQGHVFHKAAMAYKQNGKQLEGEINEFTKKYSKQIDEIVVIGYSFGASDGHIYKILNDVLINQQHTRNMFYEEAEKIPKINFHMFNYDEEETNALINKITLSFKRTFQRNMTVRKFGNGIKKQKEELIRFKLIDYS